MVKLKALCIERDVDGKRVIRIDWDNDQHQRVVIEDDSPKAIAHAMKTARSFLMNDMIQEDT